MSWALKGLNGPLKDMLTPLKAGLTLGRQADVVIQDLKVSSIHARLVLTDGNWTLEDNNSKNGVRVDGERRAIVDLRPGAKFQIGDQIFEVVETSAPFRAVEIREVARTPRAKVPVVDEQATIVRPLPAAPPPLASAPIVPPPAPPIKKQHKWYELLGAFLASNSKSFSESKRPVAPLEPALVLDFVRGIQSNSRWVIGYGPRKVGASALDLPIWEPGAPEVCFEVLPSTDGILFKTSHADLVTLNGQSIDNQVLHVGDTIRILETIIEVDFIE